MQTLIAFVGLPLVVAVTTIGLGLLAERAAQTRVPDGLLAPLGFCLATCLLLGVYALHLHVEVAVGVLIAGTAAGFALARRELPKRLNPGWPGVAALAVYVLYAAPMLVSGGWTWSGYNFLNDTAVQFLLVDHLKVTGTQSGPPALTTAGEVIRTYLESGYPLGTHAYLATLSGLLGSPVEVLYQGFVSAMAALGAMALAVLTGRIGFSARAGALVALVAVASNLAYNYGLQGSIKEVGVLCALAASMALAVEVVRADNPIAAAALLGVGAAAVLSVYSAAGVPYVLAVGVTLAATVLLVHGRRSFTRRWLGAAAAVIAATAVLSAATLTTLPQFYRVATAVVNAEDPGSSDVLGQLSAPLPLLQTGGIWLDGAFGGPIGPDETAARLTDIGLWIVVALTLLGIVAIVRRRCPEALLAFAPAVLTAALVAPGVVPYADAKLLAVMSPSVLLLAALGLLTLSVLWRPLAVALGVALAAGVMLSNAYAFHDTKIAPRDRMQAIGDVGQHLKGRGLVMWNELEEFAKYFARASSVNVASEPITPFQVKLRAPENIFGSYFDLDAQNLSYVQRFPYIVMRRSPAASRPPARYVRGYANAYYEVWMRRPRPRVLRHLSLQRVTSATARAPCREVRRLARAARRTRGPLALVAARTPRTVRFDVRGAADRSGGWRPDGGVPGVINTINPGQARGTIAIKHPGVYRAWLRGDFPRAVQMLVDGRSAGTVKGVNTAGQWLDGARVRLTAGEHRVEVRMGGGSPAPSDGAIVTIGTLALVHEEPAVLQTVPVARWRSLCGRDLDWIELVRTMR
jgi:hypothetical protein